MLLSLSDSLYSNVVDSNVTMGMTMDGGNDPFNDTDNTTMVSKI